MSDLCAGRTVIVTGAVETFGEPEELAGAIADLIARSEPPTPVSGA